MDLVESTDISSHAIFISWSFNGRFCRTTFNVRSFNLVTQSNLDVNNVSKSIPVLLQYKITIYIVKWKQSISEKKKLSSTKYIVDNLTTSILFLSKYRHDRGKLTLILSPRIFEITYTRQHVALGKTHRRHALRVMHSGEKMASLVRRLRLGEWADPGAWRLKYI